MKQKDIKQVVLLLCQALKNYALNECHPVCHPECHHVCHPECQTVYQDQIDMVGSNTVMV